MNDKINGIFGAGLRSRVAVYVPGTAAAVNAAPELADAITARTAAALSNLFGGATISLAAGAWMSDDHGLIEEQIKIVYSYCTEQQLEQHAEAVRAIAEQIKHDMRQEAVSVEINGALYFI